MSAAKDFDRTDAVTDPDVVGDDERPSGIRRVSRVAAAAHQGRASSPDIGEAPVENGVRGLRLILGFWAIVVVAAAATWFALS